MNPFTLCGTIIHAPRCGEIEVLENALVVVNEAGTIAGVYTPEAEKYADIKQTAVATKAKRGNK